MKIPSFLLHRRDRTLVFSFIILAVVAAVFWNVRTAGFVSWDDSILVYANPFYIEPYAPSLTFLWQHAFQNLYMPLTYTVWGLAANLTHTVDSSGAIKLDPGVFHSISLVLHAGSCLWAFAFIRTVLSAVYVRFNNESDANVSETRIDAAALAGTLLFAVHPIQAEAVAWISETKGLLAGFFCLAALVLYSRFLAIDADSEKGASHRKAARGYWLASTVCFGAALLAKPNVAGTPVIALMLAVLIWRKSPKSALVSLSPWFVFAGAMAVAMARLQAGSVPAGVITAPYRILVASDAVLFYLAKLLYPIDFTINYGRSHTWLMTQSWVYMLIAVPALAGYIVWRLRRQPLFLLALLWFFFALLPNLGFIPFLFQAYSTVSDRYAYFAMLGPSLALAGAIVLAGRRSPPRSAFFLVAPLLVLIGAWGYLGRRQAMVWQNSRALYTHTLSVTPRDWASLSNFGNALTEAGRYEEASAMYKKSLAIEPRAALTYNAMGKLYAKREKWDLAIQYYRTATEKDPTYYEAGRALGIVLASRGRYREALAAFEKTLAINSEDSTILTYAGQSAFGMGDVPKADAYARRAIDVYEVNPTAHLLMSLVREQQGNERLAVQEAGRALELDPYTSGARVQLARLLLKRNLKTQAEGILAEGLQLSPQDAELIAEMKRVRGS